MKTCEFNIEGMTCDHCALSITKGLSIDGVKEKEVSYPNGKASVTFDDTGVT